MQIVSQDNIMRDDFAIDSLLSIVSKNENNAVNFFQKGRHWRLL